MASTKPAFWANYKFLRQLAFSTEDSGLIFSSSWAEPKPVAHINSEYLNLGQPDTEYAILLKYDRYYITKDNRYHIYAKEATVRKICSTWNLPAASAKDLFFSTRIPYKACSEPIGTMTCIWYQLVLPSVSAGKIESNYRVHICHVMNIGTRTARTLILCPAGMNANVSIQLNKHVTSYGRANETLVWPSWFTVHLVLATIFERSSYSHYSVQLRKTVWASYNQADKSIDSVLDTECLKNCNEALELIGEFDLTMESNIRALNQMKRFPGHSTSGGQIVSSAIQNVIHGLEALVQDSSRLKHRLLSVRHTLLHAMEIRNANYMRNNTIELRRIANQAQAESEYAKKQSELSAKNAVTATRIAILTMIYLPPTFVATVFSTPFLQLDDKLQFSAANKLWVYIVSSLAFILITFMSFLPWLTERNSVPNRITQIEDDIKPQNPDDALLEPTAVALPTAKEYEREVKKMMFPDEFSDNVEDAEVDAFEWPGLPMLKKRPGLHSNTKRIIKKTLAGKRNPQEAAKWMW